MPWIFAIRTSLEVVRSRLGEAMIGLSDQNHEGEGSPGTSTHWREPKKQNAVRAFDCPSQPVRHAVTVCGFVLLLGKICSLAFLLGGALGGKRAV